MSDAPPATWLQGRMRRFRLDVLAAKDRLVRTGRFPDGETRVFRDRVLDAVSDLERDLAVVVDANVISLDADNLAALAQLLRSHGRQTTARRLQVLDQAGHVEGEGVELEGLVIVAYGARPENVLTYSAVADIDGVVVHLD